MSDEQQEIEQPAQPSALALALQKVQTEITGFDKIAAGIADLQREHPADVVVDVASAEGMKQAIKSRAAWREPRIAIEKVRKATKAPVLELGRDIDTFAAKLTAQLQVGELHYDGMIQAELSRKAEIKRQEQEREAKRVAAIKGRIEYLFGNAEREAFGKPARDIEAMLRPMSAYVVGDEFGEFKEEATAAQTAAVTALRQLLAIQQEREAAEERNRLQAEENARQAAELARQAAELEARQKAEREAREQREAEQRAREEAIRAEQKRLDDAKREAEEAKAAEARRIADEAAAAERKRLDDEAAERRAEEERQAAAARAKFAEEQRAKEAERLERIRAEEERIAKEEAQRAKAQRKLAAAQKAGPRLLEAAKLAIAAFSPQGADDLEGEQAAAMDALVGAVKEGEAS